MKLHRLAVLSMTLAASTAAPQPPVRGVAKNVIFMVPDGMGLANVTATRIFKNGPGGAPLSFETLERIGYQRTYSANSTVTESPEAASAWACGEKFAKDEVCFHNPSGAYLPSLLELAKERGKAAGLVATATVTHATPAAFGAHVPTRRCEQEIARQYLQSSQVDVILGGGYYTFRSTMPDPCGTQGDFIAEAEQRGYRTVYTAAELEQAVAAGPRQLLGLFDRLHPPSDPGLTPEYLRTPDNPEPHLYDMTRAALAALGQRPNGFFLLVEGSKVDWANHSNNLPYLLGEMLAFDQAVKVVRDWIDADPERRANTLLIVVPDHETGGFAINGPYGRLLAAGEMVDAGWTTPDHTGADVVFWSQGPGSEWLGRALDNTDFYEIVKAAARLDHNPAAQAHPPR